MFVVAIANVLLSMGTAPAEPLRDAVSWALDRETVHTGGCLAVILDLPLRECRRFRIRVAEREAVQLAERAGPTVSQGGKTIVLLSHIPGLPGGYERLPGEKNMFRVVPLFEVPGEVVITLLSGDEELGRRVVTVVPAPREAQEAIDMLFPVITPRRGVPPPGLKWTRELTDPPVGVTVTAAPHPLQGLRDELEVMKRHPDWSEIAEVLVARVEATVQYHGLIVSEQGRPIAIKDTVGHLPPLPQIVTRCLNANPRSPFAQAIQDDIRRVVKDLRILDAQRRGENVIELLKSGNPQP